MTILNPCEWWWFYKQQSSPKCNVYVFSSTNNDRLDFATPFTGNLKILIGGTSTTGVNPAIPTNTWQTSPSNNPNDIVYNQIELATSDLSYIVDETFNGIVFAYAKDDVWYYVNMGQGSNVLEFPSTLTATFTNPSGVGTWDFGDGTTSTDVDPTHEYALHGNYSVTFSNGTEYNYIAVMGGDKAPTADFTYTTNELVVDFDASLSSDPEGTDLTYEWLFGDGETGTGLTVQHTYPIGGTYEVTLIAKDAGNVWGAKTVEIQCNALPVADFTYRKNLLEVKFTNTSSDAEGAFSSYWEFGDGNISYSKDPTHTYAGDIDADVTLVVTDLEGAPSIPKVETINVRSEWVLGDEIMPQELADMESDPDNQIAFVGSQGTFEGTYLAYEGLQSYGRMQIVAPVGELEVGKIYVVTTRIQLLTGYGQIRSFTAGYVDTVNLIADGNYHEYQVPFECTDPDGDMRISIDGTANIDTFSVKESI